MVSAPSSDSDSRKFSPTLQIPYEVVYLISKMFPTESHPPERVVGQCAPEPHSLLRSFNKAQSAPFSPQVRERYGVQSFKSLSLSQKLSVWLPSSKNEFPLRKQQFKLKWGRISKTDTGY